MKIVSLEAENVKRIRAIRIEPDGSLVVIGGKNGAGKSSVIDSIAYALGGKSLCPDEPIRKGEKTACARVDLGEIVVERSWTEKDSYLKVVTAEGHVVQSPQALLNRLIEHRALDPVAFVGMEPRQQVEALRELVGLDFAELDAERAQLYSDRTIVGRDVKQFEGQLASMPVDPDAPDRLVSVVDLMDDLKRVREHNADRDVIAREAETAAEWIARITKDIERQEALLQEMLVELANATARGKEKADLLAAFEPRDTDAIERQIAEAAEVNDRYRQAAQRAIVADALEESQACYNRATAEIDALDERKRQELAAATFPVPGLSFDEDRVLLDGVPFDQASSAEQLRVSVAMAIAANPDLPVLLIRDGSLLDEDNLRMIGEMADAADCQIWLERVGDGDEVCVLIEDGEVAEVRSPAREAVSRWL